ncbi:MAG: nitroreductase family protein [Flavobacteriales bacterium]|nr:nitroreductase family protein [Flavobacteriales bacterium]|tara:strand:+ start:2825 stop:3589 length:765 start_codon:yes stop_codon:yes gene_type:complete
MVDIFKKELNINSDASVPKINKEEFIKVVKSRRSVRVYNDEVVPEDVILSSLDLALLAPNSSNLQAWKFYWVKSKEKKKKLVEYCLNQPAARTAQELIVCVARPMAWRENAKKMLEILESNDDSPEAVVNYYKKIVPLAYDQGFLGIKGFLKKIAIFFLSISKPIPREPVSFSDMKIWAQKTTALACQNLMLSLRAFGYDSCPMEGIDSARIKRLLNLSNKDQICMVISVGKRASNGVYGKRMRFDKSNFVKIV